MAKGPPKADFDCAPEGRSAHHDTHSDCFESHVFMRTLLTLINREIRSFFYQPIAYVVMFFLLLVAGFNFWLGVNVLNNRPTDATVVDIAFNIVSFWIIFILTFPLITMRTYSEEYRQGTFETLTTAPVNDWQVVASKFLGAL